MSSPRKHSLPLPGLAWRGFTLQIFFFLFLPLAGLLVAIAFGSQSLHHEAMREMVGDRDLRAARAAANSLGEEAAHRARLLQLISAQATGVDLPEADLGEEFPGGTALVSADGELIAASTGSVLVGLPPDEWRALVSGAGDFSAPFSVAGGTQPLVLALARRADGIILVGAFSPAELARQAVRGAVDPAQTTLHLVAPGGMMLYQAGPQGSSGSMAMNNALAGESGIDYHHSADGEHVIAFSPVGQTGWTLVLEESWESIAGPGLNTTQWAPLVLAPLLALALLALWFGARQVIQPLQALQAETAELARGNFEAVNEPVGGISEIQLLQADLMEMASGLESAQESLRGYIGAITAGVENERRSLARELHDDTLQTLIALQQRIQLANRGANEADPSLEAVREQVQQTITNLRRMVRGLRPIYLEDLGLAAAVEMLARESGQNGGPVVEFRVVGEERRLAGERELALYRITQEALSNVNRHARASQARVTIEYQPERVVLTVQDDGDGFKPPANPGDFASRGHFGLVGMHERAELAGGRLELSATPGQGSEVRVEIPDGG